MNKKPLPGQTIKDQLLAKKKDRIHTFLIGDDQVRGALIHSTHLVREMRHNHQLGILETLVLGHAYLGTSLMASNLKKGDRITLKIDCDGPLKGLSVDANAFGEVRGYLKVNPIPLTHPPESFDTSPFFGNGFIEVIHYPEFGNQPYTGKIKLTYGQLGLDLANYYLKSEQIPTVFNLSIKFDSQGLVTGAGGLLLQALPGTDDGLLDRLETMVKKLPSIGESFSGEGEPESYIIDNFKELKPKITGNRRVEFFCHCNKERIASLLKGMGKEILEDIILKDVFPQGSYCHNCSSEYLFSKEEIQELLDSFDNKQ